MKQRTRRWLKLARNWAIFLACILLIWLIVALVSPNTEYAFRTKYFTSHKTGVLGEETYTDWVEDICDEDTQMSVYAVSDLMAGNVEGITYTDGLYVLNDRYYIQGEDFTPLLEETEIDGYGTVTMVHGAAEALEELLTAAEEATGEKFTIGDSYIDGAQESADHGNDCYLLSYYDTSEHITGMSVDLLADGYDYRTYMHSSLAKWLQKNAWRYGYVVRYPFWEGEWTGCSFQPWHLKYVGKIHAAIMYDEGMPLEEYVEKNYSIDQRTTRFYLRDYTNPDGTVDTYVIYRQTAYEGTVFIPDTLENAEISFDNMTRDYIVSGILRK